MIQVLGGDGLHPINLGPTEAKSDQPGIIDIRKIVAEAMQNAENLYREGKVVEANQNQEKHHLAL